MKIAVDVRSLMEGRHSGVEEYTIQIIRGMLRVAPHHEYHLFYNSARSVTLPDFSSAAHIHAFRYPNKFLNFMHLIGGRPSWDVLLSRDGVVPDVVFVPHFRLLPLSHDIPLVCVVHDLSFERFPEFFSWRRRLWHKLMFPRALLQRSSHIIAVSSATKRDVVALYDVSDERVSVVYSGVRNHGVVGGDKIASACSTYRLPEHFVLYLGALEPRKNIPGIIQAFSAIADTVSQDLVIAGERGWLTGEVERALSKSRFRSRIHLAGFIPEDDKSAVYAAADLFVYPSFYEGFGFPPLEALMAGTPVVTSCNSSLPEVVGEWATLVDPYDIAELALVMKELLRELPEITDTARRAVRERYSWDQAARMTLGILEHAGQ